MCVVWYKLKPPRLRSASPACFFLAMLTAVCNMVQQRCGFVSTPAPLVDQYNSP
ncbi:hypothetical protein LguiA_029165 [Lonicera macranthoides]